MELQWEGILLVLPRLAKLKVGDFWGKVRTLPDELKLEVSQLVECFRVLDPQSLSLMSAAVKPRFSFVFLWYAKEMSVQAVRQRDHRLIFEGLASLAIENAAFDLRESIIVMTLLFNSALKLGADAPGLFLKAATLAGNNELAGALANFPNRPEEKRAISVFNFAEAETNEGLHLCRAWLNVPGTTTDSSVIFHGAQSRRTARR